MPCPYNHYHFSLPLSPIQSRPGASPLITLSVSPVLSDRLITEVPIMPSNAMAQEDQRNVSMR